MDVTEHYEAAGILCRVEGTDRGDDFSGNLRIKLHRIGIIVVDNGTGTQAVSVGCPFLETVHANLVEIASHSPAGTCMIYALSRLCIEGSPVVRGNLDPCQSSPAGHPADCEASPGHVQDPRAVIRVPAIPRRQIR